MKVVILAIAMTACIGAAPPDPTGGGDDVLVIDGVLNAGAFLVELAGDLLRFLQTGNVRNYALSLFLGLVALMVLVIGVL